MVVRRKTELYIIKIMEKDIAEGQHNRRDLCNNIILKDFLNYYFLENKHTKANNKKVTIKAKDICYFIDSVISNQDINDLTFKYIKFNKSLNITDVNTLQSRYKKNKNEGDEEKQHIVFKTFENINKAIMVYEKIIGAVTISMVETNINSVYREWIKKSYSNDEIKTEKEMKNFLLKYKIKLESIPSQDFLEEIQRMEKISLLKITVDKDRLTNDEDLNFSDEKACRDEVDIIYKPIPKISFSKKKIIKYFNNYLDKKVKIKRLVISGRREGNSITLDTERMKLSEYIESSINSDGIINSEDIFNKYHDLINNKFKNYLNEMINCEIVLDLDDEEEG